MRNRGGAVLSSNWDVVFVRQDAGGGIPCVSFA